MRILTGKVNVLRIVVISLVVAMAMPVTVLGRNQGRGRGRGRNFDRFDRKCQKFVNCHDARDGRWDGRGPRRRVDDLVRFRRFRDRDFDDDDFRHRQRRRFRNRRFDDDDFRRLQRRRRVLNTRYQDPYYNYNPSGYRRGFDWTSLVNLFFQ